MRCSDASTNLDYTKKNVVSILDHKKSAGVFGRANEQRVPRNAHVCRLFLVPSCADYSYPAARRDSKQDPIMGTREWDSSEGVGRDGRSRARAQASSSERWSECLVLSMSSECGIQVKFGSRGFSESWENGIVKESETSDQRSINEVQRSIRGGKVLSGSGAKEGNDQAKVKGAASTLWE